jgi:CubicO group peptidase (beta-lactamase class C family)
LDEVQSPDQSENNINDINVFEFYHGIRWNLQKPVTPPGKTYTYNSGSTELLGRIVQKVSGQRLEEFAKSNLFAPLGIVEFEWMHNTNGNAAASWGLRLRPRDMAKLGQLVLAQGRWGERPIVSEAWVRDSLAPHMAGQDLYYYGYQWWLGRSLVNQQDLGWAAAVGLGGQRIVIVPALDLVVVVTAGMYKSPMQGRVPLGILNRVLHAVH